MLVKDKNYFKDTESLNVFANTIQNYPAYREFTFYIKTNTETEI